MECLSDLSSNFPDLLSQILSSEKPKNGEGQDAETLNQPSFS